MMTENIMDAEARRLVDNMEPYELDMLREEVRVARVRADRARDFLSMDDTPQMWRMATCASDMLYQLFHYLPTPDDPGDESDEGCAA
jgi:hypothetical protein